MRWPLFSPLPAPGAPEKAKQAESAALPALPGADILRTTFDGPAEGRDLTAPPFPLLPFIRKKSPVPPADMVFLRSPDSVTLRGTKMKRRSVELLAVLLLLGGLLGAGEAKPSRVIVKPLQSGKGTPQSTVRRKDVKPRTADPKALAVVEAYLKAIGGVEALRSIADRYEKFQVARHSPTGKTLVIFERYLKRPNMVREDWDVDVKIGDEPLRVVQIYNGKTGEAWTKMLGYVSPLDNKMVYMLTWDKYLDDFFMHWKEDGFCLKYRSGEGEVDGEPCDVIDVYPPYGNQVWRYFFSKKTHLLVKKQWRSDTPEGPVRNEVFYSEWRKVPNPKAPDKPILVPFKHEQYTDGNLTVQRDFLQVKINSGLSDDLFKRPEGPLFTGRIQKGKKKQPDKKKALPPWKRKRRILPKGIKPKNEKAPAAEKQAEEKPAEKKKETEKK